MVIKQKCWIVQRLLGLGRGCRCLHHLHVIVYRSNMIGSEHQKDLGANAAPSKFSIHDDSELAEKANHSVWNHQEPPQIGDFTFGKVPRAGEIQKLLGENEDNKQSWSCYLVIPFYISMRQFKVQPWPKMHQNGCN